MATMKVFCRNYHGMQNPCDAGVDFNAIKPQAGRGFPCFDQSIKTCSWAIYPSPTEMEAEEKAVDDLFVEVMDARKRIVESVGNRRKVSGFIDCPKCKTGKLLFSIASNGHIHAQCTTEHCLRWLE